MLELWERTLRAVAEDKLELIDTEIDWAIKKKLLERYADKHRLSLADPRIAQLDLAYHDIRRGRGLFSLLEARGLAARATTDPAIFRAKSIPPQTTRAKLRGEFIRAAQEGRNDYTVDWVHLKLNDQAQRTVLCKDPFVAVDERVERLIASMRRRAARPISASRPHPFLVSGTICSGCDVGVRGAGAKSPGPSRLTGKVLRCVSLRPTLVRRCRPDGLALRSPVAGCGGGTPTTSNSPAATASPSAAPSAAPSTSPTPAKPKVTPSTNLDAITVTGDYGKEPKVTFKAPWAIDKTRTEVLEPGKGAVVKAGQSVTVNYYGVNGRTGKKFDDSFSRGQPVTFSLAQVVPGLLQGPDQSAPGQPGADRHARFGRLRRLRRQPAGRHRGRRHAHLRGRHRRHDAERTRRNAGAAEGGPADGQGQQGRPRGDDAQDGAARRRWSCSR